MFPVLWEVSIPCSLTGRTFHVRLENKAVLNHESKERGSITRGRGGNGEKVVSRGPRAGRGSHMPAGCSGIRYLLPAGIPYVGRPAGGLSQGLAAAQCVTAATRKFGMKWDFFSAPHIFAVFFFGRSLPQVYSAINHDAPILLMWPLGGPCPAAQHCCIVHRRR